MKITRIKIQLIMISKNSQVRDRQIHYYNNLPHLTRKKYLLILVADKALENFIKNLNNNKFKNMDMYKVVHPLDLYLNNSININLILKSVLKCFNK